MLLRVIGLFAVLSVVLLPETAQAQAACTIRTITGTYAVQITGSALIGSLVPVGAPYQLHGGAAAFAARWTIAGDGTVQGPIWGVYVAQWVESDFSGQVTVNPDCTGELVESDGSFKMVIIDNGKEIRMTPWDGFTGSVITAHRITRAREATPQCGDETFKGTYMLRCEGYTLTGEAAALASFWSLSTLTAADGTLAGKMWGKRFGIPFSSQTESAFSGTYAVGDDCTVNKEFMLDAAPGFTYKAQGILFDQGKQEFEVPLGLYAGDTLVAPMLPQACVMRRIGS